jgi:DNA-binding HxlR family transcriptional regulator
VIVAAPELDPIEKVWMSAAWGSGCKTDRRRPSAGIRAIILALYRQGATHGSELARRTGQVQSNVTSAWLPKLERYGFAHHLDVPGLGHQGGGRPAHEWELTSAGKALAELIIEEDARG